MMSVKKLEITGTVKGKMKFENFDDFNNLPEDFSIISIDYGMSLLIGIPEEFIYNGKHYYGKFLGVDLDKKVIQFGYVDDKKLFFELPLDEFLSDNVVFIAPTQLEDQYRLFEPMPENDITKESDDSNYFEDNSYVESVIDLASLATVPGVVISYFDNKYFINHNDKFVGIYVVKDNNNEYVNQLRYADEESKGILLHIIGEVFLKSTQKIDVIDTLVVDWSQVSPIEIKLFENIKKNPKKYKSSITNKRFKSFDGITDNGYILIENEDSITETLRICDIYVKS